MKNIFAIFLILFIGSTSQAQTYYSGDWGELSIPKSVRTAEDYRRYQEAGKTIGGLSFLSAIVSIGLFKYAHDMDKKADHVHIDGPLSFRATPTGTEAFFPIRQDRVTFSTRYRAQGRGARYAGVVLAVAAAFGFSLSWSMRF